MGKYVVEFVEDTHVYLINGVIVPSVSRLVSFALGGQQYKGVPKSILLSKAQYGTQVHDLIQRYEEGLIKDNEIDFLTIDPMQKVSLKQYIKLKNKYFIYPQSMEQIVHYKEKFAGRYDIFDGEYIWDIKTTSKIHEHALEWQLGLYQLCIGKPKEYGYCIWLPKGDVGQVKQIKIKSFKECEELISKYEAISSIEDERLSDLPFE